jgi:hypothetical protein
LTMVLSVYLPTCAISVARKVPGTSVRRPMSWGRLRLRARRQLCTSSGWCCSARSVTRRFACVGRFPAVTSRVRVFVFAATPPCWVEPAGLALPAQNASAMVEEILSPTGLGFKKRTHCQKSLSCREGASPSSAPFSLRRAERGCCESVRVGASRRAASPPRTTSSTKKGCGDAGVALCLPCERAGACVT